ncbi:hypothetical protein [Nostoc sp. CHAB 5715]|uniref:hypothetical protein n=1 Tax=Nostoc sp. CHAB 5715 TaxID=2780400 RepID=UPI001E4CE907|nr:hypothetical protein [Nostoc sp. CHAB 5715]MCC5620090.1 hypothetical protein [Nostoc sp. CHAB 5715]
MAKNSAVGGELSGWYINFGITAMLTNGYAYALQLFLNVDAKRLAAGYRQERIRIGFLREDREGKKRDILYYF